MSRTLLNFWLDVLLLATFLVLLWLSVVLRFLFPPGLNAGGWSLWGWRHLQWRDAQFTTLCVFTLEILLHVMLHWSWVCGVITRRWFKSSDGKKTKWDDGKRTLVGVGFMIVLLNLMGLAMAAAALTIQKPG